MAERSITARHCCNKALFALPFLLITLACAPIAMTPSPTSDPTADAASLAGIAPVNLPQNEAQRRLVQEGLKHVGKPYTQWPAGSITCGRGGGACNRNGPACFDCSGFTGYVYRTALGVRLGPTTHYQINDGMAVRGGMEHWQAGDLLIYCHGPAAPQNTYHVALYIGNGEIVHASTCRNGVTRGPAYTRNLCAVRRIVQGGPNA